MTRGILMASAMLAGVLAGGTAVASQNSASPITAELTRRAALGVALENTSEGPKVTTVTPQLTAALAGVAPGDVILSLNGKAIKSNTELVAAAGLLRAGDTTTLTIKRGAETKSLTAKATPVLWRPSRMPMSAMALSALKTADCATFW